MKTAKHIADRIRLMISTKQFQVGETLPSTRELGKQLNSSFHTVRKAYQMLVEEGLLRSERGSGYVVHRQSTLLDKSARLEMGAEKLRSVLEELVGYGLDEDEVETLFEEQLMFMEWPDRLNTSATVGATREIGDMISRAIRDQVGVKSKIITIMDYEKAVNYDALFVPLQYVRQFKGESDSGLVLPVVYSLDAAMLIAITDRAAVNNIALVAREQGSLTVLSNELKNALQFPGSIVAGVTDGRFLPPFVKEADLVLYTPDCASLVERALPERKRLLLAYQISGNTSEIIRSELWDN
ncbi:MAG: GntR family transcriptional regulator [Bacteroidetes bacterium]|nr:GntR family transcriptional regulator [Bacteroidota bacterium]MCH8524351.1 GntR family transcriptional regulator [Balneolales bacterium]